MKEKMFIVQKYVTAKNIKHALRKERFVEVSDCWLEEGWKKKELNEIFDRK